MAALSIRDLDSDVRDRLRRRAAQNGRSMEAEVRQILTDAVVDVDLSAGLAQTWRGRFASEGGVDLELPERTESARTVEFG